MRQLFSVKAFSKLSGVENTTLRYWDKIGLFSPAHRDKNSRYRYYTPDQIIEVKFILVLRHLNVSIKRISEIMQNHNPEEVLRIIEGQKKSVDEEIRHLEESRAVMDIRSQLIRLGLEAEPDKIIIRELPERVLSLGNPNEYHGTESFYHSFFHFCKAAETLGMNLSFPIGGFHDNMGTFLKDPNRPDKFFSLDPTKGNFTRKAGRYLVACDRCYYGQMGNIHHRMQNYAEEHSLEITGPVFTIFLLDEISAGPSQKYLAQAYVAIE